jgi:hypothetical protein
MLDLNYVIGADGQKTLSATGSTIQSATITTSGFPVKVTVTGDAEPVGAGWHRLQIYRDSTTIGEILHVQTTTGGVNMTIAMSTIDTPVAGTYTYSVKIVGSNGMSAVYTEMGQLSMIVEEKIISSFFANNWLRRDISSPTVYYGYSTDTNAANTDDNWFIKKVTTAGSVETVTWTNGSPNYNISKWNDRVASFVQPTGALGVTWSVSVPSLSISWNQLTGVDRYQVVVRESGKLYSDLGSEIYNNGSLQVTKEVVNVGSYTYNKASSGLTYSVTITGVNVAGTTASTVTITT